MKKDRIAKEKKIVAEMVKIYCRGVHKTEKGRLCGDCRELVDYALARLDNCRWGNGKNFCSQCPCHCYKPDMRAKIKKVMRFSGPRIIFSHPIAGTAHAIATVKAVIGEKRKNR